MSFRLVSAVKLTSKVTAGGNMLSTFMEKEKNVREKAARVGLICLGSVQPVTRILINIFRQLISRSIFQPEQWARGDEP